MLAIDSGNTRTKWAVFADDGRIQEAGVCLNAELAAFVIPPSWQLCKHAIVANVAGERVAASMTALLKKAGLSYVWAKAEAETLGLKNKYEVPESLGVDRWAALLAAFKRYLNQPACLVVNAGTALTIDAIYQNAFIGGLIVPGFSMMQNALLQNTSAVNPQSGQAKTFPLNTADASYSGVLSAIVGAIVMQADKLESHCQDVPTVVITGGDAAMLMPILTQVFGAKPVLADNLVLEGLYLMERAKS
ncbi:type III pantothenate kinase [Candidatus Methylopumilus turicensis]|uniref:Type III pantothenate kinase n=1 Tax=Candidatus Methylopumilus turicensis TaxID=1581680 RepID=A0A0B7J0Y3_9PROT|nr:type III pantothenate kinase [Candidatus Methylopumilus turicensis]CEN56313.1 Type III pantothenate kinase [Candidatus Methylopumilus turicensis]